jgi:hypothetical protein
MPVFRSNTVIATVKNIKAFLNVEAGITRSAPPELKRAQQEAAPQLFTQDGQGTTSRGAPRVRPESLVWMFSYGSGRAGTTWLSKMLKHLDGYDLWKSPRVGSLFGDFYYDHPASLRGGDRTDHILSPEKETWLGPLRSFVLEGIALRFPELGKPGSDLQYLFISEHHGSLGAPLIMDALPESRMLLIMRDPRDVAASTREASKSSGWVRKVEGVDERTLADINPIAFMKAHVEQNVRSMAHARQAYEAHRGPKAILKYEDLRADTLSTMRQTLSALDLPFEDAQLVEAVEKFSWDNVPDKKKGEGKFHRKATPGGWKEDLSEEEIRIVEEGFEALINEFYADASVAR